MHSLLGKINNLYKISEILREEGARLKLHPDHLLENRFRPSAGNRKQIGSEIDAQYENRKFQVAQTWEIGGKSYFWVIFFLFSFQDQFHNLFIVVSLYRAGGPKLIFWQAVWIAT